MKEKDNKTEAQHDDSRGQPQTVEQLLVLMPSGIGTDTALTLMEVYESIERSYRAAVLAGEAQPQVTQSTNY